MSRLPTLGIFGPSHTDKSGVVQYIAESSNALSELFDIDVAGNRSSRSPFDFDFVMYHLGNNAYHHGAFLALQERPGLAILHEYLHLDYYFQTWSSQTALRQQEILRDLAHSVSEPLPDLASYFGLCARRKIDPYAVDVGIERNALKQALLTVVHSPAVAEMLRSRYPGTPIETVRFPVRESQVSLRDKDLAQFGIASTDFVFGTFGFVGEYKRVDRLVDAWRSWEKRPAHLRLVIVGEHQIKVNTAADGVIATGWVDDELFELLLSRTDCGVQLRDPSLGETSAPAAWLGAHGKRLILSQIPEMRGLGSAESTVYVSNAPELAVAELRGAMIQMSDSLPSAGHGSGTGWGTWATRIHSLLMDGPP